MAPPRARRSRPTTVWQFPQRAFGAVGIAQDVEVRLHAARRSCSATSALGHGQTSIPCQKTPRAVSEPSGTPAPDQTSHPAPGRCWDVTYIIATSFSPLNCPGRLRDPQERKKPRPLENRDRGLT